RTRRLPKCVTALSLYVASHPCPSRRLCVGIFLAQPGRSISSRAQFVACNSQPACVSQNGCRKPYLHHQRKHQREHTTLTFHLKTWCTCWVGEGGWRSRCVILAYKCIARLWTMR